MDKIIEILSSYFSAKFREKLKRIKTLDALIVKLEKKERKLEAKFAAAQTVEEKKKINKQLTVLKAQKEKAQQLAQENSDEQG